MQHGDAASEALVDSGRIRELQTKDKNFSPVTFLPLSPSCCCIVQQKTSSQELQTGGSLFSVRKRSNRQTVGSVWNKTKLLLVTCHYWINAKMIVESFFVGKKFGCLSWQFIQTRTRQKADRWIGIYCLPSTSAFSFRRWQDAYSPALSRHTQFSPTLLVLEVKMMSL